MQSPCQDVWLDLPSDPRLDLSGSGLVFVRNRTGFGSKIPLQIQLSLRCRASRGGRFDIKIRVPVWATRGFFVKINGRKRSVKAVPGTYLTLRRNWRDNDTIELRMPFPFYLDPVVDQPNVASIFYDPVLLAAEESGPRTDWRPVTLDAGDIGKSITGDPATLRFSVGGIAFMPH